MDVAGFKSRAPEFEKAATSRIQAAIDSATLRTDADVFGDSTEDAIFYLAAHILAASPSGREARLKTVPQDTTYLVERRRLEQLYGAGWGAL